MSSIIPTIRDLIISPTNGMWNWTGTGIINPVLIRGIQQTSLDRSIGNILHCLTEKNLAEKTIIWFLSDNGGAPNYGGNNTPLRGAKHTEWEGGIRVVSLLCWPGEISAGTKNDRMIAYIDIAPTLLKIAGSKHQVGFDGINVWESIAGKSPDRCPA